jgi:hypothetical protein
MPSQPSAYPTASSAGKFHRGGKDVGLSTPSSSSFRARTSNRPGPHPARVADKPFWIAKGERESSLPASIFVFGTPSKRGGPIGRATSPLARWIVVVAALTWQRLQVIPTLVSVSSVAAFEA